MANQKLPYLTDLEVKGQGVKGTSSLDIELWEGNAPWDRPFKSALTSIKRRKKYRKKQKNTNKHIAKEHEAKLYKSDVVTINTAINAHKLL